VGLKHDQAHAFKTLEDPAQCGAIGRLFELVRDGLAGGGELAAGLEATWGMIAGTLARCIVADLGHVFNPPATLSEAERQIFGPSTRQEIIYHVLRHDIHHGGELAVGMGGYHLPTIWAS